MARLRPATVGCIPNASPPIAEPADEACVHPWLLDEGREGQVFVSVSRLVRVKNVPLLLKALRIASGTIAARLIIIGRGPEERAIRALVNGMGLDERVHLAGFVSSPAAYLARSDAFVQASSEEGFGQSLVEAMAQGLPVISTDSAGGGPRFVLDDGRYGLLTPNGNAADLAAAMVTMADRAVRERYAALARQRVVAFSPAVVGAQWLRFIDEVLRGRKTPRVGRLHAAALAHRAGEPRRRLGRP
jgi:glycosyltransferase involved in cell wall biosynthesis